MTLLRARFGDRNSPNRIFETLESVKRGGHQSRSQPPSRTPMRVLPQSSPDLFRDELFSLVYRSAIRVLNGLGAWLRDDWRMT